MKWNQSIHSQRPRLTAELSSKWGWEQGAGEMREEGRKEREKEKEKEMNMFRSLVWERYKKKSFNGGSMCCFLSLYLSLVIRFCLWDCFWAIWSIGYATGYCVVCWIILYGHLQYIQVDNVLRRVMQHTPYGSNHTNTIRWAKGKANHMGTTSVFNFHLSTVPSILPIYLWAKRKKYVVLLKFEISFSYILKVCFRSIILNVTCWYQLYFILNLFWTKVLF